MSQAEVQDNLTIGGLEGNVAFSEDRNVFSGPADVACSGQGGDGESG